jgi:hypothetical protein
MTQRITLTYEDELTPELRRYIAALMDGRITGHRCPACGRVYVPGKGFCPLCMTPTTQRDEVEVGDHGVVTGFTVITPVAYPGAAPDRAVRVRVRAAGRRVKRARRYGGRAGHHRDTA